MQALSPAGLTVEVQRGERSVTLVASGSLDVATGARLREVALRCCIGARHALLDLRQVTFIDSSGLGTLLNLRTELRRSGVPLSIEATAGPVRRGIESTGLGEILAG